MLWWIWILQLQGFWRQKLLFLFCSYTWQLLALCLLTFIDVIHFYVNDAALTIARGSTSAHQTSVQAKLWHFKMVKKLLLLFDVNLLLAYFYGKKNFFHSVSGLAELHTCLVWGFRLNFIFVGVGTGNFNIVEAHARFNSEVAEKHLCFYGASFHHWVMGTLAVECLCEVTHPRGVKPGFLSLSTARGKFLISYKIFCDSC